MKKVVLYLGNSSETLNNSRKGGLSHKFHRLVESSSITLDNLEKDGLSHLLHFMDWMKNLSGPVVEKGFLVP